MFGHHLRQEFPHSLTPYSPLVQVEKIAVRGFDSIQDPTIFRTNGRCPSILEIQKWVRKSRVF